MFVFPLFFAWVEPYFSHLVPDYETKRLMYVITGDVMFVSSFFVWGGGFWDKIRALFVHGAVTRKSGDV